MEKIFNHETFNYFALFGHLWEAGLTFRYIFAFKFILRSQQPDIFPITYLPPASTTIAKLVAKLAAGVVDPGCKFATGVVNTGGAP
jgi:hypothetical protein